MSKHLQAISRPGGLFDDTTVTGSRWQGQQRRIRVVLYRRLKTMAKCHPLLKWRRRSMTWPPNGSPHWPLLESTPNGPMVKAFYQWLLSWFNPNPPLADGNPESLLQLAPIRVMTIYPSAMTLPNS